MKIRTGKIQILKSEYTVTKDDGSEEKKPTVSLRATIPKEQFNKRRDELIENRMDGYVVSAIIGDISVTRPYFVKKDGFKEHYEKAKRERTKIAEEMLNDLVETLGATKINVIETDGPSSSDNDEVKGIVKKKLEDTRQLLNEAGEAFEQGLEAGETYPAETVKEMLGQLVDILNVQVNSIAEVVN